MLMGTDPLRELGSTAAAAIDRSDEDGGSPASRTASCGDPTARPARLDAPRPPRSRHAPTSGRSSSRTGCAVMTCTSPVRRTTSTAETLSSRRPHGLAPDRADPHALCAARSEATGVQSSRALSTKTKTHRPLRAPARIRTQRTDSALPTRTSPSAGRATSDTKEEMMRFVSTIPHHARWRSRLGAILEAGAAIRTLVARLVTGGDHPPTHPPTRHPPRHPPRHPTVLADHQPSAGNETKTEATGCTPRRGRAS